jgi:predicted nuclease with RNAse H fold
MIKYFAGIDVQISRGCSYYLTDAEKKYITSGWVKERIPQSFKYLFQEISKNQHETIAVGIDAPRMPIQNFRTRYFDKKKNLWIEKPKKSIGRECEVMINSFRLANCQWTNTLENSPKWMQLGFKIFSELKDFTSVHEVFPSASYRMLKKEKLKYELCLNDFVSGAKDMLDASVAALTVYEFINGRGCEVGGDDGLGTIVLPRKISL